MKELQKDPAIKKIIEYGKSKKHITYDELNDLLPSELNSSEKLDEIIELLEKNNISLEEAEEDFDEDDVAGLSGTSYNGGSSSGSAPAASSGGARSP